uniref:Stabilin 2 n=1 Tax=Buteo japonicus TaxID=224669 RepID=A0A8C0BRM7_9AVES
MGRFLLWLSLGKKKKRRLLFSVCSGGMKKQCDQKLLIRMKTECVPCSLNLETQCPAGYTKITNGTGIPDCRYYLEIKTHTLSFPGCRHHCMKEFEQPECCQGHWGPDCMACPGGAASPCNRRGRCSQGINGDGTCTCQVPNPSLHIVCSCVHGVCNSGITGDGRCTCLSGYKGLSCDEPIAECEALRCPENSRCTPSGEDGRQLQCTCLPNYHGDGTQCEPINPCSKKVCDPNADCIYLGPNRHKCTCREGYRGDGQVCLPIDPCQAIYGNCPAQSTVCIYDGPGKSHCECKEHYTNFVPGKGCSMTDICETNNMCHKKAKCSMVAPGQITCTCQGGSVGNGFVCYGNIAERLRDLNAEVGGWWQGKLTSALSLVENVYEWPLSTLGPFTVLVPTNKGLKGTNIKDLLNNKQKAQYFVKLHVIAGQLNTSSLNNTNVIYTLTGKSGEISKGEKDNQLRIRIQGGRSKGKLLQGNIIASNGILHIIDKAMDNVEPTFESSKEETIMSVLQDNGRYSQFTSLIEKTGLGMDLQQDHRSYTVFVPSNEALSNMKAEALDYLLSAEVQSFYNTNLSQIVDIYLEIASLASIEHIRSTAKQFIYFNRTSTGQVLVSGEEMEETDIVAKNGRIYTLAGVLIPPTIVPILPHRCDETRSQVAMGVCTSCLSHALAPCPPDSKSIVKDICFISQEPKCCKGFFGPDCSPCPGGFSKPCSGNGRCMDGLDGNGTCVCAEAFQGSHCQFCSDPGKYGPQCDKECLCIYGKCDNRIDSNGICLPGSCRSGYTGKLCDKQIVPCKPSLLFCHAHADCQLSDGAMPPKRPEQMPLHLLQAECIRMGPGEHTCVCQAGWTGDGRDCSAINNCLLPTAAGCHENATCIYVGPGQNDCKCKDGFRGNGIECTPINSCLEQNGKCHHLATCQFESSRGWECVCPKGYEGDGRICYGNMVLKMNYFPLFTFMQEAEINSVLSTTSNLTVLVPSLQAIENMDEDEKAFWMSKSNIPTLLKYHVLTGAYSFADFQNLSTSDMLPTSLQSNFLHLSKENGNLTLEGAHIVAGDITSTNGIIHVIDKVLTPLRSTVMPRLLARLEQMPDYSIFRGYIIQYSLANEIEAANTYTVFAPNNDAIEDYLRDKKPATLDESQVRYHIVLDEKLLKNNLHNGMHRETMLGFSYQVGFFLHNSQLFINDAPISYTNVATDKGIIHGLGKVLEIQKNRCDINDTVITVSGSCRICSQPSSCPPGTKEIVSILSLTRECCAGFFGQQCQPCPGKAGNACFGNGVCLDGINGTGTCECGEGFVGTACESCVGGKYGRNCDQACACVHGKCSAGIDGDGSCECDVGWRGVTCETGNCLFLSNGTAYCKCAAGFEGNGTFCTAIDACKTSNGGCSAKAECRRTTPGNRACVCNAGYTGDGIVCIEINPCLESNGGCDRNAECTQTGPNQVSTLSVQVNKTGQLFINNGGCSEFATCNDTELTERTCTCKRNYIGDGFKCRGNIFQVKCCTYLLSLIFLQIALSIRDIAGPGPFTLFVPRTDVLNSDPRVKDWVAKGVMAQVLRYHMVGCASLLYSDLTRVTNITSLHGDPIHISYSQNSLVLNNKAEIILRDAVGTNGVIHVINQILVPSHIQDFPLKKVCAAHCHSQPRAFSTKNNLLGLINDPIHKPVTLFWPTDAAIRGLPQEQLDFLFKKANTDKLVQYLKFHIVRDAVLAYQLPLSTSLKTLQGSNLSISCGDNREIGALFLNDRQCRIVQRQLEFDGGIAYGIDCLLTDPSLGGRCNSFFTVDFMVSPLFLVPPTLAKTRPKVLKKKTYWNLYFNYKTNTCVNCSMVIHTAKCCKGYFGPDCQACPGGPETPCNNHGSCDDGYDGTGECRCDSGFNGTSCELCLPGRYSSSCRPCECKTHGQCDEGYSGTGRCFCETGWTGRLCETKLALQPACSPSCSANAVCTENNTCQCKPFYDGDGITCTAADLCKQNNGGCHKAAECTQLGVKVFCSCQKGYKGDGFTCLPVNPCADGFNGGCHEHAVCTVIGPDKRKCECKNNYIGDGLNCSVMQLPLDRCLQDNGQCHPDADCADLHFQDTTVGVFHLRSPQGQYKMTYEKAKEACANESATIATYNQLLYAQKARYHLCAAGWLDGERVGYPTAFSSPNCGSGYVGIVDYGRRVNLSETWDVFCYREKEVDCTCKPGYVGDGFSCSGNLLQVLMSFPTVTNFLSDIMAYSNSSRKGREFLRYLTDLSVRATLFAPNDSGLRENETLSGRDIEYHLSNASIMFYEDLTNGTTLLTRLGEKLLITNTRGQEYQSEIRYVDGSAIVEWDIIASNGIIHVISEPLKAPPAHAPLHASTGTGIFFGICLVTGIVAFIGYSYLRFRKRNTSFQHFKVGNDTDVTSLDKSQPSITNPSYESSSALTPPEPTYDLFSVSVHFDLRLRHN